MIGMMIVCHGSAPKASGFISMERKRGEVRSLAVVHGHRGVGVHRERGRVYMKRTKVGCASRALVWPMLSMDGTTAIPTAPPRVMRHDRRVRCVLALMVMLGC